MKQRFVCASSLCWSLLALTGCTAQIVEHSGATHSAPLSGAAPFVPEQLQFSRVRQARAATANSLEELFRQRGWSYPAAEMFLRVFKRERELEVWVRSAGSDRFDLLRKYPICALAGVLGPKRIVGDAQVPEGFYTIDLFNPVSSYHLSLRIDYPNQHDRNAAPRGRSLGGDIFIHGGCKSDGCLAITDEAIRELYWLAVTTRGTGEKTIAVHIFPTRFTEPSYQRQTKRAFQDSPELLAFWETLRPGYDYFERTRRLPPISVDARGRYRVNQGVAIR